MTLTAKLIQSNPVTRTLVRETRRYSNVLTGVNRNNAKRVAELIGLRVNPLIPQLDEMQFKIEAKKYGQEAAALHAFADVESDGNGTTAEGRLKILWEPHVFSRATAHVYDWRAGPEGMGCVMSYPKWYDPRKPKTAIPPRCTIHPYSMSMAMRWNMLAFAAEVDFDGALQGCSWGAFQILGENWKVLGYASPWHYVVSMYDGGEPAQLNAAMRFLEHKGVDDDMRKGNWGAVIEAWNGSGQVDFYLKRFLNRLAARRSVYNVKR